MVHEREFSVDQERAELEAMVERLARSPRLANLLRYIGEKYLRGEASQLREHNIAIDVFGRPRTFDPSQDAIARVEAHRLRKKLKLYYETEGKSSPIQVSIPPGTYVPVFASPADAPQIQPAEPAPPEPAVPDRAVPERALQVRASAVEEPGVPAEPSAGVPLTQKESKTPRSFRKWVWPAVAGALVLVASIAWLILFRGNLQRQIHEPSNPPRAALAPTAPGAWSLAGAVRLLAGYSGPVHVDPSGVVWQPDRYFERGGAWISSAAFVARTNDQSLFQTIRTGEFSYSIPLRPGVYELHLYFVEPSYGPGLGGGESSRAFNVVVNGKVLLPGFDILSDAGGPNIADERVFKDLKPASDGNLHFTIDSLVGKPILNAIAVLPGIPHKQLPIRLTSQSSVYVDHAGQAWSPDNYYLGGQPSLRKPPVTGTSEPGLFITERYGHFTYAIPAVPGSLYTVSLYFTEFYFGPQSIGRGGIGSRTFNVVCNGDTILRDFDIYREAGSLRGVTKTFRHIKPTAQGKINLTFEPVINYATISAIEVVDETQ